MIFQVSGFIILEPDFRVKPQDFVNFQSLILVSDPTKILLTEREIMP